MSELAANARDYVANNAAESGADVLITQLAARIEALEAALDNLQSAETAYRMSYGLHGHHDQHTLEARDALGIAGYRARKVLSATRAALDKDEGE